MFAIFNYVGSLFGYILWAVFYVVQNFGIAIIIFTLIFRFLLFPSSVKQQKSMAANSRLQAKQRELKEKYGNNKAKYNEEIQKLYDREGTSPFSGCITSLFPFVIMLGIYYAVVRPLSNVVHVSADTMAKINMLPGVFVTQNNIYSEMNVLKIFTHQSTVDALLQSGVPQADVTGIQHLAGGFNFLGLDLLSIPSTYGFGSPLILIPILCLVTSLGSQIITMRMNGSPMQQQPGCMKYMMYLLPLITVYISYIVPGAVGFYWVWSTIFGFVQTVIIQKFYSAANLTAQSEARHIALMELKEAQVPYEYHPMSQPSQGNTKNKKKK